MALINCPNCNGIISDKASICPHCECNLERKERNRKVRNKLTVVIVLLCIVLICIGIVVSELYSRSARKKHLENCNAGNHEYVIIETQITTCLSYEKRISKCKYCEEICEEKGDYVYHNFGANGICTRCKLSKNPPSNSSVPKTIFKISNVDDWKKSSYTLFTGKITNVDNRTHKFATVKLKLKIGAQVVDSDWTYAVGSEGISPGESARFEIYYSGDAYWTDYEIELLDYQ